ncbi:MAG: alpha-amylase [Candidatus Symbiothrix sp.]|jgi:1,4-alpha-glucan branching enzyme|nr:alpha-amylase [Candidatus Symbiothrix sp.]
MKHILLSLLFLSFLFACEDPIENKNNPPRLDDLHLGDGITRISDDSLAFVLFAPQKQSVYLIGDFNNWQTSDAYKMQKDGDRFWIKIGIPDKNKEYVCQYLIDNTIRIADPYSNKIADPWNDAAIPAAIYPNLIPYPTGKTTEIAMVVSTKEDRYNWKINNFAVETGRDPSLQSLVIYEILIRDFTEEHSIKGVQAKLPYLKSLGVEAIELMPFNEFEANDSWGYNPSFYFATDKAYGASNDYKAFIDECHAEGMAVIMDMVLNHSYGQSPLVRMYQNGDKVSADNPWYNVNSPNTSYSWGYDFNHESKYTQAFVDSVCAFWLKEYKIDGFRFDFTKGFTNKTGDGQAYDQSRIDILERMTSEIRKRKKDALVIFEHLADNSEEKVLAENGILLWGNLNYNMNEATMGYGDEMNGSSRKGDLSWASYKQRGWNQPSLVAYMESHDEERIMFKNEVYGKTASGYDVKNPATGLKRTEAAAVILFSIPGPKMIWQFGELGYDFPLEGNGADRLGKKPIRWDYYDDANRKALYDVYAKMIDLRKNKAVFSTADYAIDLATNFKYLVLKSSDETVVAMANFDVIPVNKTVNFSRTGKWTDYFSGNELTTGSATENITLQPDEYRLYFSK